jgi:hypothetical protein
MNAAAKTKPGSLLISRLSGSRSISAVVMLAAFTLGFLRMIENGRASREPQYDDLSYLMAATGRIDLAKSEGLLSLLSSFFVNPPHSPYAETLALFGLLLSPNSTHGTYALHSGIILILLFFVFRLPHFGVSLALTALTSSLIFLGPVGFFLADEFRPDPVYFLLVCAALAGKLRSFLGDRQPLEIVFYSILGLLWFVKPSFWVVTFGLGIVAIGLDVFSNRNAPRFLVPKGLWVWLTLSFIAGFTVLPRAVEYVFRSTIGEYEDIWVDSGLTPIDIYISNVNQSFQCILTFFEVAVMCFGVLAFALRFPLAKFELRWLLYLTLFQITISASMVLIRSHSVFFGMHLVFGAFLFMIFQVLVASAGGRRVALPSALITHSAVVQRTLVVSLLCVLTISSSIPSSSYFSRSLPAELNAVNNNIVEVIFKDCSASPVCLQNMRNGVAPTTFVGTISIINSDTINWHFWRGGLSKTAVGVDFFPGTSVLSEAGRFDATYLILAGERLSQASQSFLANRLQTEWRTELEGSVEWKRISVGGDFSVYVDRSN